MNSLLNYQGIRFFTDRIQSIVLFRQFFKPTDLNSSVKEHLEIAELGYRFVMLILLIHASY